MEDHKISSTHVEEIEDVFPLKHGLKAKLAVMGTVKLTEGAIVYIPAPSADPRDPLNMAPWHKMVFLIIVSMFGTLGLALVSGFGGLLGFYIPQYVAAGKGFADITALMTYPSLFMGIGNLIGIPLAIAVGRRIVFLGAIIVLIVSAILCATAKNYEWHLAARMVLGLAAGQSEALVPMMVQEIHFLHERARCLMIQNAIQTVTTAVWVLFASPIAQAITPQWWYALGAALAGVLFVLSIFLIPETKYKRQLSAFQETTSSNISSEDLEDASHEPKQAPILCKEKPPLDLVNYPPRTWSSDMRLWVDKPEWYKAVEVIKNVFELILFPNVFWVMCLNGLTIGVNIAIGTTYGNIVTGPPYNWPQSSASYVNCGQIVVALIALPMLGHGSDKLIKWKANRNEGFHEPEARIIPLIFPIIVGIFTAVLYGQGASHPGHYHWFVYIWCTAAYYFTFVGANIVGITYLLDSYPARAGPLLIIICAFRGIISFGVSYGTASFIESHGYDGAFGTFAGLTGALGLLGVPIYIWGKQIRQFTGRFAKSKKDE